MFPLARVPFGLPIFDPQPGQNHQWLLSPFTHLKTTEPAASSPGGLAPDSSILTLRGLRSAAGLCRVDVFHATQDLVQEELTVVVLEPKRGLEH